MKIDIRALFPPGTDEDTPVFVISIAAQISGLHARPAQLRRSPGQPRPRPWRPALLGQDIAVLREVQRLSQEDV